MAVPCFSIMWLIFSNYFIISTMLGILISYLWYELKFFPDFDYCFYFAIGVFVVIIFFGTTTFLKTVSKTCIYQYF